MRTEATIQLFIGHIHPQLTFPTRKRIRGRELFVPRESFPGLGSSKRHTNFLGGGCMTINGSSVLVTGANRGIGKALVDEALRRGAKHVYAAARTPITYADRRVTPLKLDITNASDIQAALEQVTSLDVLVNNAGVAVYDNLGDRGAIEQSLSVNLYGTHAMIQAFLPALAQSEGAIVNVLSIAGLASLPIIPAYSISKAAAFSMSQSFRALLAPHGISVHVVLPGPVDTEMSRGLNIPKASPESVARAIFDGVDLGEEDIFPDPASASLTQAWRNGALKELERQNAALVRAQPVSA
jgi:NAD(P)-dependent dehydrogenase (short-subunit alcohol dehydrogenase family)